MKNFIKKLLPYILTVAIVVGCAWIIADNKIEKSYDLGYDAGYDYGYERGEDIGYSNGCYDEKAKHSDLINFVDNYVVFCTDQGKKYHKFDCYHFQNNRDSFYVFNISYAKHLGYEPCSDCFG